MENWAVVGPVGDPDMSGIGFPQASILPGGFDGREPTEEARKECDGRELRFSRLQILRNPPVD